jgi:mono/diheme cytochrome c family protein
MFVPVFGLEEPGWVLVHQATKGDPGMKMTRFLMTLGFAAALVAVAIFATPDQAQANFDEASLEVSPAVILMADGKAVYMKKCKKCHGEDGKGQTKIGKKHKSPDFTSGAWQGKNGKAKVVKSVTNGVFKDGVKTKMKAFKEKLSTEEISAVADYVKAFK